MRIIIRRNCPSYAMLALGAQLTAGICLSSAKAQVAAFAEQVPPPAPDYALASSWASGPNSPDMIVPRGASPAARKTAVDVFFIHPTTFLSKTRWNQDVSDKQTNAWTDASTIARQASIFNGCCRIYAPRYRQASLLNDQVGGRDRALELAYTDIERAFDHYIKYQNDGRPFILAGHSQGGYMVAKLLEKRIDGTSLQTKMVAAYAIGFNLAEGDFSRRFRHIRVCDMPAQTGCVVQWNAVLTTTDLAAGARLAEQGFVQKYGDIPAKQTLCVNPLTFARLKLSAEIGDSLGAVPGDPGEGALRPLRVNAVSAHCDHGFLVVEPSPALALKPLPGGSMHYHDFGLFYADVRANAVLRANTYLSTHRAK